MFNTIFFSIDSLMGCCSDRSAWEFFCNVFCRFMDKFFLISRCGIKKEKSEAKEEEEKVDEIVPDEEEEVTVVKKKKKKKDKTE